MEASTWEQQRAHREWRHEGLVDWVVGLWTWHSTDKKRQAQSLAEMEVK